MFKIKKDTMHITRGDKAIFDVTLAGYTFQPGDIIGFRVYQAEALENLPLIDKTVVVETETEAVEIVLQPSDTKIGQLLNEVVDYWYEIDLNGEQTPFCYDENGPKIFRLYPEGAGLNGYS